VVLQYLYHEEKYTLSVEWHGPDGKSTIHTTIVERLTSRHGDSFMGYREVAQELDEKVDKLYRCIHVFNDEHHGIPYNPKHRNMFLNAFSDVCVSLETGLGSDLSEQAQVLLSLFQTIQSTLQEMVGVYLAEHAYQSKHWDRLRHLETRTKAVNQLEAAYEFDSLLTEMISLSHMLERLTEIQRKRIIRHLYHNETLREIAEDEGVSKQSVQESITAAIQKLRSLL